MEKILLVDDVKLLREIQRGLLSSSPVQVLTASDGFEALEVARKELPSLIVMDNHMPNMDGVTCCRELKKDSQLKHIPIIMLTNAMHPADFEGYLAAGVGDCLAKPIDSRKFLTTIKKYLPVVECRGIRVPLCTEVSLLANDSFHVGMTKDISLKGIQLTSTHHPAPSDEIRFSFLLPGSKDPTEIRGKVAWVRNKSENGKTGGQSEFGVEFIEVTGKGIPFVRKSELEAFVNKSAAAMTS
jgi:CheY-like chemotaxis protein